MLRRILAFASIAFALSMFAATVDATTAQRTFVASTGNDAGACSIAAPCRGFARAITQTSAGGEVIVLDSAGYGPVTITQSVSIIAPSGVYAGVSVSSGDGIVLNAGGIYVVLRGLTINGQGGANGINVIAAYELHVENCVVSGMGNNGIEFTAGTALLIKDSIVRDNSKIGVHITGYATIEHSRVERNGSYGLALYGGKVSIVDVTVSQNSDNGIYMQAFVDVSVERTVIQGSGLWDP